MSCVERLQVGVSDLKPITQTTQTTHKSPNALILLGIVKNENNP